MFSRRLTDEIKEVSNETQQKSKEKTGEGVESNIQVNIQTIGSPEKKNRKNSVKRG